ncbi:hypothetical protein ACSFA2_03710 [Variovorax sp. LT2P21]|uniref:hypothetical protein n=1 Tax=Variovorax sp. LT2P21 TaxID=3443731 RepID=UPI003F4786B6
MQIIIEKDTATHIPKECTRDEAAAFAAQFPVTVVTEDENVPWADFVEANPVGDEDGHAPDEKAVIDSLLKRKAMSKSAFKKLPVAEREKLVVEETALMASEAQG